MIPYLSPDFINALTQRKYIAGSQGAQDHPERTTDEERRLPSARSSVLPNSKHVRRSLLKHSLRWLATHFGNERGA
jgi:hypothetical protein